MCSFDILELIFVRNVIIKCCMEDCNKPKSILVYMALITCIRSLPVGVYSLASLKKQPESSSHLVVFSFAYVQHRPANSK